MKFIAGFVMLILVSGCCTIKTQGEIHEDISSKGGGSLCDDKGHVTRPIMYSGTALDLSILLWPAIGDCHGEGCMFILVWPLLIIPTLIDLPLDIVADTAILPYTATVSVNYTCPKKEHEAKDIPKISDPTPAAGPAKKVAVKSSVGPAEARPIVTPQVGKPPSKSPLHGGPQTVEEPISQK